MRAWGDNSAQKRKPPQAAAPVAAQPKVQGGAGASGIPKNNFLVVGQEEMDKNIYDKNLYE